MLSEWILGIAVQSEKKAYYLDLIKTFSEEVSNTIVQTAFNVLKKGDINDEEDEENKLKDHHNNHNSNYEYGNYNYMSEKIDEQDKKSLFSIQVYFLRFICVFANVSLL